MTASLWNRICMFLAFAGLFVAGYLSLSSIFDWAIPCNGSHSCDIVQHSQYAVFLGIDVAYLGFATYIVLVAFSLLRAFGNPDTRKACTTGGVILSGIGTLFSMYLVYMSITEIHQTCIWCLTSALIMTLSFLAHGFLSQADYQGSPSPGKDGIFAAVLTVLFLIGIGLRFIDVQKSTYVPNPMANVANATIDQMIPPNPHVMGPDDGKVVIIEFGDLMCPHCKNAYQTLHDVVQRSHGQVELIFRQFPLTRIHPYAALAATVSEMAAEKGRFWDFLDLIYGSPDQESIKPDDILAMAKQVGLDPKEVAQRTKNPKDPALLAVEADMKAGTDLQLEQTPTFLWGMRGQKVHGGGMNQLKDSMSLPPFNKYVEGLL